MKLSQGLNTRQRITGNKSLLREGELSFPRDKPYKCLPNTKNKSVLHSLYLCMHIYVYVDNICNSNNHRKETIKLSRGGIWEKLKVGKERGAYVIVF